MARQLLIPTISTLLDDRGFFNLTQIANKSLKLHQIFTKSSMVLENNNECINRHYSAVYREKIYQNKPQIAQTSPNFQQKFYDA